MEEKMLLLHVEEKDHWLISHWSLTYRVGWEQLLKASVFVSTDYIQLEVLADNDIIPIKNKDEIMDLEEKGSICIRGLSKMLKVPVMMTFHNQTGVVVVSVAMANDEFSKADYEKFNKSMSQYLNSIELSMYR